MDIDYKQLGQRIKFARVRKEMTQEYLADKANLSPTHISNIETGNTKVSLPSLVIVANLLDVSIDSLLSDSVYHAKNGLIREALELMENCTESEVRTMVTMLETLKQSLRENNALYEKFTDSDKE